MVRIHLRVYVCDTVGNTYVDARGLRPGVVLSKSSWNVGVTELGTGLVHTEELELGARTRADTVRGCRG